MQNFDPKALVEDVARLSKELEDVRSIIAGTKPFNLADFAEAGEAGLGVAANFIPRLANIEAILAPLVPLLPLLQDMFKGELAGVGETQRAAMAGDVSAIIPAHELGNYSEKPAEVIAEAAAQVQPSSEGEADKVEGTEGQSQGTA